MKKQETFNVLSLERDDLKDYLTQKQINKLSDSDMKYIADKMVNDCLMESYWIALEYVLTDRLNLKIK